MVIVTQRLSGARAGIGGKRFDPDHRPKSFSSGAKDGFTLVESLATITIIIILSVLSLASYRTSQEQIKLRQATYEVLSALREMQQLALSGTETGGSTPSGYGVFLTYTSTSYKLFIDEGNGFYVEGVDTIIETRELPAGIGLTLKLAGDPLRATCNAMSPNDISVVFSPPIPKTTVKRNPGAKYCDAVCAFLSFNNRYSRVTVISSSGAMSVNLNAPDPSLADACPWPPV